MHLPRERLTAGSPGELLVLFHAARHISEYTRFPGKANEPEDQGK